ncbi:MAG: asparagine synthetase A [Thermoplasmata archaeon]|nr:asparagine synthetase A [Thermoplasmata archaeon]
MRTQSITWMPEMKAERTKPAMAAPSHDTAEAAHARISESVLNRRSVFKTERMQAVLKLQDKLFRIVRDEMSRAGYLELQAPIIGPATDPGIRGAGQVSFDYYGTEFKIMSSMILYKQMAADTLGKIYAFSPNVRLEPLASAVTGRHLAEFYQIDMEEADGTMDSTMRHVEQLIFVVAKKVKETAGDELKVLGRRLDAPEGRFKTYTYAQMHAMAEKEGVPFKFGDELPWEAEAAVSKKERYPFWVVDYPTGSRGFYYIEDPDRPGTLRTMDLIYPEGFGEAGSGGEREYRHDVVAMKMREGGDDPAKYKWYMDMLREGIRPSCGIGLGVERMTRYLTGQYSIVDCAPFPKVPGLASP